MHITKTHKIIISAVTIIILLGLYIIIDKKAKNQVISTNTIEQTATTTSFGSTVVGSQNTGNYMIEKVAVSEPVPDLSRPVIFSNSISLSPETKTAVTAKITELQAKLKKDSTYFDAWLDLGMYQKTTGDYAGTVLSWQYASKLAPTSFVPLGNLGNLYAYFLNDSKKAETYYKQAIANGPTQPHLYTQLAEVYRDIFKDLDKARAIIAKGLANIPNDPNLLQFQASLK